jgi:hypothetical protein
VLILLFGVEVVPPSFADKVKTYCVLVARVVVVRAYLAPSLAAAVVTTEKELLPTYFWVVLWDKVELPRAAQPVVLLPSSMEPFVTKFAAELVVRSETGLVVSTLSSCAPPLFWTWKAVVVLVEVLIAALPLTERLSLTRLHPCWKYEAPLTLSEPTTVVLPAVSAPPVPPSAQEFTIVTYKIQ